MALRGALPNWDTKKISIKSPPGPREVYWIGTFVDSLEPEFTGYHQGVIISGAKTLNEATECVVFVPVTSVEPAKGPRGNLPPYIHKLSSNPSPNDTRGSWAICNHVMTVRLSRLERFYSSDGIDKRLITPKVSHADFEAILDCIANGMVVIRNRFKSLESATLAKQQEAHTAEIEKLKAEQAAAIDRAVEEVLDELTRPSAA
ncbi:type II toxin-antitoxin system PemK/MazF family toxin [Mesorhizobium sp. LCM 4576]|uniref:type II toxin-antitoxin system PemK/MazF family toxin n=1 Tax=Mesorhizobium sp. LCM 4576 TaxID=1848289 RepID=UPI000A89B242|nr:type II toxin-antitoxin system PemK/MazF family toxin [Mesorhizobium sp. LCM 4576]